MHFHIAYTVNPDQRDAAQKRFMSTGAMPPEGVAMHGRWHCAEGLAGFMIAEAESAVALAKWTQDWTDLLEFEITPVVNDEEMMGVIGS
jgi:hypothetical protein